MNPQCCLFFGGETTKILEIFCSFIHGFRKKGIDLVIRKTALFSFFFMTKRKIFCSFYFYKMGRWRFRKANRQNQKGIKGESETSHFSSNIVIQERSALYYNVIDGSIYRVYCVFCYYDCKVIG